MRYLICALAFLLTVVVLGLYNTFYFIPNFWEDDKEHHVVLTGSVVSGSWSAIVDNDMRNFYFNNTDEKTRWDYFIGLDLDDAWQDSVSQPSLEEFVAEIIVKTVHKIVWIDSLRYSGAIKR